MHFPVLQINPPNAPTDFLQSHSHPDRTLLMLLTTQPLRKTVCRHFLRGNILQPNDLIHNRVPDEMVTDVDMFHLAWLTGFFARAIAP
jgi:hypothetical protein